MSNIITGHEADIEAIKHDAALWETSIKSQLRHIIAIAQQALTDLDLKHDVLGKPFLPGDNKVNDFYLDAIIASAERIKKLQS